jgi:hypothetical protein
VIILGVLIGLAVAAVLIVRHELRNNIDLLE